MLKKSASSRQQIGGQRRRRHLDHDADRHRRAPDRRARAAFRPRAPRPLRAARSSSTPETNGNMIRSGPCAAARSSARSCAWKISSSARLRRMPRRPSGARVPSTPACSIGSCGLADVERPHGHAPAGRALEQPPVGDVLRLLGRARVCPPPASRNSDRNSPMPSAPALPRPRRRRPAIRCWPRAGSRRRPR